jgi:hypothetical protein
MTRIDIKDSHDEATRRLEFLLPAERTGLVVEVGDTRDRSKLEATVRVEGRMAPDRVESRVAPGGICKNATDGTEKTRSDSSRSLYAKTLLLLVAGLAMAFTFMIIARGLSAALVPLVLLVSLATLYLFALFLVPTKNGRGLRTFTVILKALISAAFSSDRKG